MWRAKLGSELVEPQPGRTAVCPACDAPVVARCGRVNAWHWAHRAGKDCDPWSEGETEWHLAWKKRMPHVEQVIRRDGQTHRADAVTVSGKIIEFQHSPIGLNEVTEREEFYGHDHMVWVLDATNVTDRIGLAHLEANSYLLRWAYAKRWIDQSTEPIYLDTAEILIHLGKRSAVYSCVWEATIGTHETFVAWANGETAPSGDFERAHAVAMQKHRDYPLEAALGRQFKAPGRRGEQAWTLVPRSNSLPQSSIAGEEETSWAEWVRDRFAYTLERGPDLPHDIE